MKSKLKPSNSFCDTLGIHIPKIKLALVTIYRPPKCPQFRLKECLETVRDWASSLETEGQPTATILISTDINLGFLENMNEEKLEATKEAIEKRTNIGKAVAGHKIQARMLIEFVEDHFPIQHKSENTRKEAFWILCFQMIKISSSNAHKFNM